MLDAYLAAFWAKDVDRIVQLLQYDATWDMPPFLNHYRGAENIGELIDTQCPGGIHDMPMLRTVANGQPAFGLYMRQPEGHFEPFHMQVLDLVRHQGPPRHRVLRRRALPAVRPPRTPAGRLAAATRPTG